MAEAAVGTRFYCHGCNKHFQTSSKNLTCPQCESTFVEELSNDSSLLDSSMSSDVEIEETSSDEPQRLQEMLRRSYMQRATEIVTPNGSYDSGGPEDFFSALFSNSHPHFAPSSTSTDPTSSNATPRRTAVRTASGPATHTRPVERIRRTTVTAGGGNNHSVILEGFLQSLINSGDPSSMFGGNTTINITSNGEFPFPMGMFSLHGEPGDYAWGTNGLDDVITQLLGQLENSGAPPASDVTIKTLPVFTISKEHVDAKKDCSVCMETFAEGDKAKKLPCEHLFHISCIDQWLELHNTCPVCRKNIDASSTNCPRNSSANANAHATPGPSTSGV